MPKERTGTLVFKTARTLPNGLTLTSIRRTKLGQNSFKSGL
ncbi:MAG: hypothetical protein QM784_29465 [Polyangiaceae bacterium]